MRTIWKYPVPITDRFTLQIPGGYSFLDVQVQRDGYDNEGAMLWALVDPEKPKEAVDFVLVGTGRSYPDEDDGSFWHVGTFQMRGGALVWHLFYRDPLADLDYVS